MRKLAECASSVLGRSVTHRTIRKILDKRTEIEECKVGNRGAYLVRPRNEIDNMFEDTLEQKLLRIHRLGIQNNLTPRRSFLKVSQALFAADHFSSANFTTTISLHNDLWKGCR